MTYVGPTFGVVYGDRCFCLHCEAFKDTKFVADNDWECPDCGAGEADIWPEEDGQDYLKTI